MPSTTDSFGRRAGRAFTRLVVTLVVLALLGVVGLLLSQLNARTFTLQTQDGKLLVMKGRMLPLGSEPYRPSDPLLSSAYAPIDLLGGGAAGLEGAKFDERDALDRALFQFLEGLARPRLVSDDPAILQQGLVALATGCSAPSSLPPPRWRRRCVERSTPSIPTPPTAPPRRLPPDPAIRLAGPHPTLERSDACRRTRRSAMLRRRGDPSHQRDVTGGAGST